MRQKVAALVNKGYEAFHPRPASVIAVIDSGIIPSHDSFKDTGIPGPVPERYEYNNRYNNKVVKYKSYKWVTIIDDRTGHGTFVASVAAGNIVEDANVNGNARGRHCGTAPLALLVIYNVADENGRISNDSILAAMHDAIDYEVDIISISIGAPWTDFRSDSIAKGACRAAMRNILVVCAGGNDGPCMNTLCNHKLPWILLVGATHAYTSFSATVELGDCRKTKLRGESLHPRDRPFPPTKYPLVLFSSYQEMVARAQEVKQKVVALYHHDTRQDMVAAGRFVQTHSGYGLIVINYKPYGYSIPLQDHKIPTIYISYNDGCTLRDYVLGQSKQQKPPTAALAFLPADETNPMGRAVAGFSSRGPDGLLARGYHPPPPVLDQSGQPIPQLCVLKPDVVAHGANRLGASHLDPEKFVVDSGTSFACPDVAGCAAVLTRENPSWARLAIKSTFLTTADNKDKAGKPIQDQNKEPAKLYDIGCGFVNLHKARNPGLLYDVDARKEIPAYLRGFGHSNSEISEWAGFKVTGTDIMTGPQLNYPSFAIEFGDRVQKYTRKVKNVAKPDSRYKLHTDAPPGVQITVGLVEPPPIPEHIITIDPPPEHIITIDPPELKITIDPVPVELQFSSQCQSLEYSIEFELKSDEQFPQTGVSEGSVTWESDTGHLVRSPILVVKRN